LIAYFLGNISAKYYENPTMISRVIAKNKVKQQVKSALVSRRLGPFLDHFALINP